MFKFSLSRRAKKVSPKNFKKREEDAGYDVFGFLPDGKDFYQLKPGESVNLETGIKVAFEPGYALELKNKSSVGSKGLIVSAGLIDSGYRNTFSVPMINISDKTIVLYQDKDERFIESFENCNILDDVIKINLFKKAITQAVLIKIGTEVAEEVEPLEIDSIPSSRGANGFGSTDSIEKY